jgi:hypothetical protein
MKTLLHISSALLILISMIQEGTAQENKNDTTKLIFGNTKVIILSHNESDTIHKKEPLRKEFNSWSGIELGVNGLLTSSNSTSLPKELNYMELDYSKSLVWNINFADVSWSWLKHDVGEEYRKRSFGLCSGLGISFRNYSFENNSQLVNVNDSTFGVLDTNQTYSKNKLRTSYLRLPVMLEFYTLRKKGSKVKNGFHFAAGVVGGLRMGTSYKTKQKINGNEKTKNKIKDDFNLAPFLLDAEVRVGYVGIDVFASYGLTPLFEDGKGPELYPITIGLSLTKSL